MRTVRRFVQLVVRYGIVSVAVVDRFSRTERMPLCCTNVLWVWR